MAFLNKSVSGNNSEKVVFVTDSTKEGSIHGIYIQNSTGSVGTFTLLIDGAISLYNISIDANSYKALEKPVNVSTNSTVSVIMSTGVSALFSILEVAIDVGAALSTVEAISAQTEAYMEQALEAAQNAVDSVTALLPLGAVADASIGNTTTWSSTKINTQIALGAMIDCGNAGVTHETTIDGGVA